MIFCPYNYSVINGVMTTVAFESYIRCGAIYYYYYFALLSTRRTRVVSATWEVYIRSIRASVVQNVLEFIYEENNNYRSSAREHVSIRVV